MKGPNGEKTANFRGRCCWLSFLIVESFPFLQKFTISFELCFKTFSEKKPSKKSRKLWKLLRLLQKLLILLKLYCRKLVGCPTENSQVYTFSTNIFLTSVHVQLYPVTGKIYKKYIYIYIRLLGHSSVSSKLCNINLLGK